MWQINQKGRNPKKADTNLNNVNKPNSTKPGKGKASVNETNSSNSDKAQSYIDKFMNTPQSQRRNLSQHHTPPTPPENLHDRTTGKMDTKLKAVRSGHKGAITRLWKNFGDIRDTSEIEIEDVTAILDSVLQKKDILKDLNDKIVDASSDEDVVDEIQQTDEYMFDLD
ncbi:unnamed protein product [Mytilus edulis]|uniref:Uncharacterized protein n=1 Tax=Mytilus edulis TaxID=6550 RepID=A0A8S3UUS6_MYTED|nr:unnamed protein product [Mytilus edulis]